MSATTLKENENLLGALLPDGQVSDTTLKENENLLGTLLPDGQVSVTLHRDLSLDIS